MTIGERLNYLRENELKISQEEFGSKIGVSRFSISNYESGKRSLTDRVITDICREFSINETWLRDGSGPMTRPPKTIDNMIMEEIAKLIMSDDEFTKNFIYDYLKLSNEAKQEVKNFIKSISKFAE